MVPTMGPALRARYTVTVFFLLIAACKTSGPPAPHVLAFDHGPLYSEPGRVESACEEAEAVTRNARSVLLAASVETADLDSVLYPWNRMAGTLENAAGVMSLLANVHPLEAVRKSAEVCEQRLQRLGSAIELDPALYRRVAAVEDAALDPEAQRFKHKVLERLLLAGVDRSDEVRARLAALHEEMVVVGQTFQRNIRDDVRKIEVDRDALVGLPEDFVAAHPVNENGKVVLDTNYPDFFPVQTYADQSAVREALVRAFSSRGHPANEVVLKKLLELRHEYAVLLGQRSWAELRAKDKMVETADRIRSFTEEVAELARPRMQRDLEEVLSEKRQREPGAQQVQKWDRFYWVKEVQKKKHAFDPAEARLYLGYRSVLEGVFALFSELFEIEIVPTERPVWHPSVQSYELRQGGRAVGRFFLDMHAREGKYGHAAMFPLTTGLWEGALSEAALVCNFPDPNSGPALMEHSQVVTLFHEFGHLMHHLLARNSQFVNQSGISTEWDFVEAPSQLLEEWAFDAGVLARFARHHETGAPMPARLIERMRSARDFGLGIHVMRQVFYQSLSLELHDRSPEDLDLARLSHELEARYAPYPPLEGTHEYASFGHLDGYSSMYYTYQWSLALAKDMFTRFAEAGLLSHEAARSYRDAVLQPGGMKPARALVSDFLGRASTLDAYRAWLSGAN